MTVGSFSAMTLTGDRLFDEDGENLLASLLGLGRDFLEAGFLDEAVLVGVFRQRLDDGLSAVADANRGDQEVRAMDGPVVGGGGDCRGRVMHAHQFDEFGGQFPDGQQFGPERGVVESEDLELDAAGGRVFPVVFDEDLRAFFGGE